MEEYLTIWGQPVANFTNPYTGQKFVIVGKESTCYVYTINSPHFIVALEVSYSSYEEAYKALEPYLVTPNIAR